MTSRSSRDFSTPEQRQSLRNLYQSLFFLELLCPSRTLWLFSGWISDIAIVDNRARQFHSLCPNWGSRIILLSECLDALCERGGSVVLVLRKVEHNEKFISIIKKTRNWQRGSVGLVSTELQHAKAMVSEHFMIDGSMNYTHSGIEVNSEKITYRVENRGTQEELLRLEEKWGGSIQWGPNG
jgi:hypothetical protein